VKLVLISLVNASNKCIDYLGALYYLGDT